MAKPKADSTRFERLRRRAENSPVIAVVLVTALVVGGIKASFEGIGYVRALVSDEIVIAVLLDEPNSRSAETLDSLLDVGYTTLVSDNSAIRSRVGYLDLIAAGGLIPAFPCNANEGIFGIAWPQLDVRIVNNSTSTLFLAQLVAVVEVSEPDRNPIPVFCSMDHEFAQVWLQNVGWEPMEAVVLRYRLLAPRESVIGASEGPHRLALGIVRDTATLNFTSSLEREGVDVASLQSWWSRSEDGQNESPSDDDVATWLGRFAEPKAIRGAAEDEEPPLLSEGSAAIGLDPHAAAAERLREDQEKARIGGTIQYRTSTGAVVKLRIELPIALSPPEGLGDFAPYGAEGEIILRSAGRNYTSDPMPLSHVIKPGATERFAVKLSAPMTSNHRFRLQIADVGGRVFLSRPLQAEIFAPRFMGQLQSFAVPAGIAPELINHRDVKFAHKPGGA